MVSLWRGGLLSIALGVGLFVVAFGVWQWRAGFVALAARAEGTVVDLTRGDTSGSTRVRRGLAPVIRFETNGRTITFVGEVYSSPPDYTIGDRVHVLYDRTNPRDARVDGFWEAWLFPLICAVIGLACLGGGALELKNTVRERAKRIARKR